MNRQFDPAIRGPWPSATTSMHMQFLVEAGFLPFKNPLSCTAGTQVPWTVKWGSGLGSLSTQSQHAAKQAHGYDPSLLSVTLLSFLSCLGTYLCTPTTKETKVLQQRKFGNELLTGDNTLWRARLKTCIEKHLTQMGLLNKYIQLSKSLSESNI